MLKQFVEMRKMLKAMGGVAGGGRKGRQRLMGMLGGWEEPNSNSSEPRLSAVGGSEVRS